MADKPTSTPKAIASLAKKPTETTRGGSTQKLKFVPTLPARRRKDELKQEPAASSSSNTPAGESSRGQGRGRVRSAGTRGAATGRGRGERPVRPPAVEMTASGPFAMGPSGAGVSSSRISSRTTVAPMAPPPIAGGITSAANLTQTATSTAKREQRSKSVLDKQTEDDDVEVYSDQEGDIEFIDIQRVRSLDWMAPEPVRRERQRRKIKREASVKSEQGAGEGTRLGDLLHTNEADEVDAMNAIDLSESEEEEEMDNLVDEFTSHTADESNSERIFLFQFPEPFPQFHPQDTDVSLTNAKGKAVEKRVSFTEDTKPGPSEEVSGLNVEQKPGVQEPENVDGIIGQLEIHQSGAIKMRLANGILMDVTAATQPSFLQHAVHIDPIHSRMHVLGEISRRFVVTPDLDTLLDAMARVDVANEQPLQPELDNTGLIPMDTS